MTTFGPAAEAANSWSGSDRDRCLLDDGELLGCDLLARLAEHVRVLEPDVREQDDVRAEHVRRVVAAAEPGLDHRDVDPARRELGERRRADASNWVARCCSASGRTRASAASRSASSPSTVIRSAHERTCGETVAPTESPSASSSASIVRVAVDLPFVPTTWIAG